MFGSHRKKGFHLQADMSRDMSDVSCCLTCPHRHPFGQSQEERWHADVACAVDEWPTGQLAFDFHVFRSHDITSTYSSQDTQRDVSL